MATHCRQKVDDTLELSLAGMQMCLQDADGLSLIALFKAATPCLPSPLQVVPTHVNLVVSVFNRRNHTLTLPVVHALLATLQVSCCCCTCWLSGAALLAFWLNLRVSLGT